MSIQYGPGYDPLDQPSTGPGIETITTYSELVNLEPATDGMETIITNGIPGSSITARQSSDNYCASVDI